MPRAAKISASPASYPLACTECDMTFSRKAELVRHAKTHSPNVDAFKTACPYEGCSYKALQKHNVKTHITAVHMKLRPHHCRAVGCSADFGDAAALIRHEKKQHGILRNGSAKTSRAAKAATNRGMRRGCVASACLPTTAESTEMALEVSNVDLPFDSVVYNFNPTDYDTSLTGLQWSGCFQTDLSIFPEFDGSLMHHSTLPEFVPGSSSCHQSDGHPRAIPYFTDTSFTAAALNTAMFDPIIPEPMQLNGLPYYPLPSLSPSTTSHSSDCDVTQQLELFMATLATPSPLSSCESLSPLCHVPAFHIDAHSLWDAGLGDAFH